MIIKNVYNHISYLDVIKLLLTENKESSYIFQCLVICLAASAWQAGWQADEIQVNLKFSNKF